MHVIESALPFGSRFDVLALWRVELPFRSGGLGLAQPARHHHAAYFGSLSSCASTFANSPIFQPLWPAGAFQSRVNPSLRHSLHQNGALFTEAQTAILANWDGQSAVSQHYLSEIVHAGVKANIFEITLKMPRDHQRSTTHLLNSHTFPGDEPAYTAHPFSQFAVGHNQLKDNDFAGVLAARFDLSHGSLGPCRACSQPSDPRGHHASHCQAGTGIDITRVQRLLIQRGKRYFSSWVSQQLLVRSTSSRSLMGARGMVMLSFRVDCNKLVSMARCSWM